MHADTRRQTDVKVNTSVFRRPTFAGGLDADGLETSIEGGGIDDVRVKVAVVLPVDEERHDDGDNQAHDHGYDNTHVQSHVVCTRGHCRRSGRDKREKGQNCLLRSHEFTSTALFLSTRWW